MIIHAWRVTDTHGNRCDVAVADNDEETVHVWGMRTPDGEPLHFESKGYHLGNWAEENGLKLERFQVDVNLDEMTVWLQREGLVSNNSSMSWWQQLGRCYEKGYLAQQAGVPNDDNPYRTGYSGNGASRGGNVQRQRQASWARGWERASLGKPLDDSNG